MAVLDQMPLMVASVEGKKCFALARVSPGKDAKFPDSIALSYVLRTGYPAVAWK